MRARATTPSPISSFTSASAAKPASRSPRPPARCANACSRSPRCPARSTSAAPARSEEHTSELQVTHAHIVCRLLLEKNKNQPLPTNTTQYFHLHNTYHH